MATQQSITRVDLDAGKVDLAELDSGERLAPIHPGRVLQHDFLDPLHLTANALALALRVPANRITAILAGRRAITAETALRLACHLGTSPGFWLNLRKGRELELAEREEGARISFRWPSPIASTTTRQLPIRPQGLA